MGMSWINLLFEVIGWGRVFIYMIILSRLFLDAWLARTVGGVESWLEAGSLIRNRHGVIRLILFVVVSSYAGFHNADSSWLREARLLLLLLWTSHVYMQWFLALDPCRRWYLVSTANILGPYARTFIFIAATAGALAHFQGLDKITNLSLAAIMLFAAVGALVFCCVAWRQALPIRRALAAYYLELEENGQIKAKKNKALKDRTLKIVERNRLLFEATSIEAQFNALMRLLGFGILSAAVACYAADRDIHAAARDPSYTTMHGFNTWRHTSIAHLVDEAIDLLLPLYWCIYMQPLFVDAPHTRCLRNKSTTNDIEQQQSSVIIDDENVFMNNRTSSIPAVTRPGEMTQVIRTKRDKEPSTTSIINQSPTQVNGPNFSKWYVEWQSATAALPGSGAAASLQAHLQREANHMTPWWQRKAPSGLKKKFQSKNLHVSGPRPLEYDIRINIDELFIVDEMLGVPVASLFAGRDTFVVCFERIHGLWIELGRTEILRNDTNPQFCRCIGVRASDKEEIELGLVVFNLNRNSTSSDPDPEWAAYSDGARRDFFPPIYIDSENLADHHPIAIAVCNLPINNSELQTNDATSIGSPAGKAIAAGIVVAPLVLAVRSELQKPTRVGGDITVKYRLMTYEKIDIIARSFALPLDIRSMHHSSKKDVRHDAYFGPLESVLHHHHQPESPKSPRKESQSWVFRTSLFARVSAAGKRGHNVSKLKKHRYHHRYHGHELERNNHHHDLELSNVVVNPIRDLDDDNVHHDNQRIHHSRNSTWKKPSDALMREELVDCPFAVSVPVVVLRRLAHARAADAATLAKRYINEEIRLLSAEAHRHKHKVMEYALTARKKRITAKLAWLQAHVADLEATAALYLRLASGYECGQLAAEDGGHKVNPFRPSPAKNIAGLAFQPVNLQTQRLVLDDQDLGRPSRIELATTCGCFAAHSLKFKKGGALQLDRKFSMRYRNLVAREQRRRRMFTPRVSSFRTRSSKNLMSPEIISEQAQKNYVDENETKEESILSPVEENDQDVIAKVLRKKASVSFVDDDDNEAATPVYDVDNGNKVLHDSITEQHQVDNSSIQASCHSSSSPSLSKNKRNVSKDCTNTSSCSADEGTLPSTRYRIHRMLSSLGGGRPTSVRRTMSSSSPRPRGSILPRFMESRSSFVWKKSESKNSDVDHGGLDDDEEEDFDDDDVDIDNETEDSDDEEDDDYDDEPDTPASTAEITSRQYSNTNDTAVDIGETNPSDCDDRNFTAGENNEETLAVEEESVTDIVEEAHTEEVPSKTLYHSNELEGSEWPRDMSKIPLDSKLLDLHRRLQRRFDRILSQALATLACCTKTEVERRCRRLAEIGQLEDKIIATEDDPISLLKLGLLVQFESLLSTRGQELGMISDYCHAVQALAHCVVVLVDAKSQPNPDVYFTESTCVSDYRVSISRLLPITCLVVPVDVDVNNVFGNNRVELTVVPILFTQGINEMQTVANAVGDTAIQDEINRVALARLTSYFESFDALDNERDQQGHHRKHGSVSGLRLDLDAIRRVVVGSSSLHDYYNTRKRKRWRILALVADFVRHLGGKHYCFDYHYNIYIM